jgi:hypothetical protein
VLVLVHVHVSEQLDAVTIERDGESECATQIS